MTSPTYDVVAIGNAIVDILAQAEDSFIEEIGVAKGSMQLIFSPEDADALYARMGPGREISGGSAANTVAGIAALGGRTAFIGQVADDQLGQVFAHDIRAAGVDFDTASRAGQPATARMCCSNWLTMQASSVQWPELCTRGAISFTSRAPSRATNNSTVKTPT